MHTNIAEHMNPTRTGRQVSAVECSNCGLYGLCRVAGLDAPTPDLIDEVVTRQETIASGQHLVTAGQPFAEIVAVRSGAFQTTTQLASGEEQVIDFFLPGELIGLDAVGGGSYPHKVEALGESSICRFKLSRLHLLKHHVGEFQQQLIRALSRKSRRDQWAPLLMGAKNAEQRMAMFLLFLSSRYTEHGFHGLKFRLPMSRQHIADYLGLAMETVSRVLKRFHTQGIVSVHARSIALCNVEELRAVARIAN